VVVVYAFIENRLLDQVRDRLQLKNYAFDGLSHPGRAPGAGFSLLLASKEILALATGVAQVGDDASAGREGLGGRHVTRLAYLKFQLDR
jgi:hypothetical protein